MTGRRAVGGVLAMGMLLGLVGLGPVVTDASSRSTSTAAATTAAPTPGTTNPAPFDSGPLVLLLVAAGLGTMGLLSREPAPDRRAARR